MTAALIVNPRSGGTNRKGLRLAEMLCGTNTDVTVLDRFETLAPTLERLATEAAETLFISSGDGTIQEIQTRIAEDGLFKRFPTLCLLPHGSTNMTAADIGFSDRSLERQRELILAAGRGMMDGRCITRPTVRVENPADGRPRHGMFLGGGAIAAATLYCQRAFNRRGIRGGLANAATLAVAVGRTLLGLGGDETERFDRPHPMAVRVDDQPLHEGDQLAVLVTTLEKLILGARPFWGGGGRGMRVSIFGHPPPRFLLRWLPAVLYGGEKRRLPENMRSYTATTVEIATPSGFILDGEAFMPPQDEPLRISLGPEFTYLTGRNDT